MRKIFKFILALAFVLCMVAPVQAATHDYWADVYSWDGKMTVDGKPVLTRLTTYVTFKVLAVGADTSETLTYYGGTTSLTNPVTTTNFASDTVCNDRVAFRCDPTDATNDRDVDLIVVNTVGGYTAFVEDFSYYNHTIIIDQRPNIQHHGCIWFAASIIETDTGIDFDYHTAIGKVIVEVVTVDAGETLNVGLLSTGTGGDADGFTAAMSVATVGYAVNSSANLGVLLRDDSQDFVYTVYSNHEQSLTYSGTSDQDTAAGYIHYYFTRMR